MEEKLNYFRLILTIYKELRQLLNDAANQKKGRKLYSFKKWI